MVIKVTYANFLGQGCDAPSLDLLIRETAQSLNEGGYVEFEDGKQCFNEQELREAIEEKR